MKLRIIFLNCYEKMATGMRILAQIALDTGYDVRIIVLHGETDYYRKVKITEGESNARSLLRNGKLYPRALRHAPISLQGIYFT